MADVIVKLNLAPGVCHRAAAEPERISAARSPTRAPTRSIEHLVDKRRHCRRRPFDDHSASRREDLEGTQAHAAGYDLVYWIAAEKLAAVPDQLAALAVELGLDPAPDPESLLGQVHRRLRAIDSWLLIFDDADSASELRPWLPHGPLAPGMAGHVIVTTRRGGFASVGQVSQLNVVGPSDALALLRTRAPSLNADTGAQLAEELGRLPLALEQAGAYLDRTAIPPEEYLRMLGHRAADLYGLGQVSGRDDTIATLWNVSLDRVAVENPAAVQLLQLCAYLALERIPVRLFTAHPDCLPDPLATTVADELALNEAIGVLVDYSLLKRTTAELQIHRLVQGAVRARFAQPQPAFASTGPPSSEIFLPPVLALLRADLPGAITGTPEDWPRWAVLLPHVLTATDHYEELPEQEDITALDASWLLDRAAVYLKVNGRPALAERALAIDQAVYGPDDPNVAIDLTSLALILLDLGRSRDARLFAERALAITETTYGSDDPRLAGKLSNLALILLSLGQAQDARTLAERALAIDQAVKGPCHPDVATDLNNLIMILAERALAITENAYGPDHPDISARLNNLALIVRDLGQAEQARPLAERALKIAETTYGHSHPDVAIRLGTLALILQDLGHLADARILAERALTITENAYGSDHPVVAIRLSTLALIHHDAGQIREAQALAECALAISEATYGPDHPDVAIRLGNLAAINYDLGQIQQAQALAERALAITENAAGLTSR